MTTTPTYGNGGYDIRHYGLDIQYDPATDAWKARRRSGRLPPRHCAASTSTSVDYGGVPMEFILPGTDIRTGFMATPDGANVVGQPEVAAGWYPVNDHPIDKASYSFDVSVPDGYEVVANGILRDRDQREGWTTWEWEAREPLASYLAMIDIGYWDVHRWRTESGIPVYDAVDTAVTGALRPDARSYRPPGLGLGQRRAWVNRIGG